MILAKLFLSIWCFQSLHSGPLNTSLFFKLCEGISSAHPLLGHWRATPLCYSSLFHLASWLPFGAESCSWRCRYSPLNSLCMASEWLPYPWRGLCMACCWSWWQQTHAGARTRRKAPICWRPAAGAGETTPAGRSCPGRRAERSCCASTASSCSLGRWACSRPDPRLCTPSAAPAMFSEGLRRCLETPSGLRQSSTRPSPRSAWFLWTPSFPHVRSSRRVSRIPTFWISHQRKKCHRLSCFQSCHHLYGDNRVKNNKSMTKRKWDSKIEIPIFVFLNMFIKVLGPPVGKEHKDSMLREGRRGVFSGERK